MSNEEEGARGHVVGVIRNVRKNKDGTTAFSVSGKSFRKKFVLSSKSQHNWFIQKDLRVLVGFIHTGRKYPRIERVIHNPEGIQIRRIAEWVQGKGSLPV